MTLGSINTRLEVGKQILASCGLYGMAVPSESVHISLDRVLSLQVARVVKNGRRQLTGSKEWRKRRVICRSHPLVVKSCCKCSILSAMQLLFRALISCRKPAKTGFNRART